MKLTTLFFVFIYSCSFRWAASVSDEKQIRSGIEIMNTNGLDIRELAQNIKCFLDQGYEFIQLNFQDDENMLSHAKDIQNIIAMHNKIALTIILSAHDNIEDVLSSTKSLLSEAANLLWLNVENITGVKTIINTLHSSAKKHGLRIGIHDSQDDITNSLFPVRFALGHTLRSSRRIRECSITIKNYRQSTFTGPESSNPTDTTHNNGTIEQAFTITDYEKIKWDTFPTVLDCLRKTSTAAFLTVYDGNQFLQVIVDLIPQILTRGFKLFVSINPQVYNSTDDYVSVLENLDKMLGTYGAKTNCVFYYTGHGTSYAGDTLKGLSYMLRAIENMRMQMAIATNQAQWVGAYNNTGLYSDFALWHTDYLPGFANFTSYGGWKTPVAYSSVFVEDCIEFFEKQSIKYVNYKPELMQGMNVFKIGNPTAESPEPNSSSSKTSSTATTRLETTTQMMVKTSPSTVSTATSSIGPRFSTKPYSVRTSSNSVSTTEEPIQTTIIEKATTDQTTVEHTTVERTTFEHTAVEQTTFEHTTVEQTTVEHTTVQQDTTTSRSTNLNASHLLLLSLTSYYFSFS